MLPELWIFYEITEQFLTFRLYNKNLENLISSYKNTLRFLFEKVCHKTIFPVLVLRLCNLFHCGTVRIECGMEQNGTPLWLLNHPKNHSPKRTSFSLFLVIFWWSDVWYKHYKKQRNRFYNHRKHSPTTSVFFLGMSKEKPYR